MLQGGKTSIINAVNKTEYFTAQAREVHGDKYDYSLVDYKGCDIKIIIISKYGEFLLSPKKHLFGRGCPIESKNNFIDYIKSNPIGWTYGNWEKASKKSKKFTGFKMYILECWDTNEKFYKVGKTYNDISYRYKCKNKLPYNYNILYTFKSDNAREICELEYQYLNQNKEFRYIPQKQFCGMGECFSKISVEYNSLCT